MGFNDFWIHNNGKKERLSDPKHGVRKDQIDQKFQNLFDAYDVNQDGTLEGNELAGIFKSLKAFAGADKILDKTENNLISSIFKNEAGIEDTDFQGFVKALSDASEEIIESSAAKGEDGGNIITTKYKDGTTEIIYYYPDGEYKMKKTIQDTVNISYSFEGKTYTGEELEKRIKKDYKNFTSLKDSLTFYTYEGFAQKFFEKHKVKRNVTENHKDLLDISERAKKDIEVKDFILSHFIETHRNTKEAMDTMGILDDIGAAINAGAGELWNASKNIYNKYFGEGAEEDYQNFYELVKKFEPNYDKALSLNGAMETMRNHPEMYVEGFQKNTGLKIDNSSAEKFKVITEQFQNAQIMKQRIDILNQAMREVGLYQTEQNALTYAPVQNEGLNPASHILKANELLLQYFNGDKEAADLVLQGVIGNADKTMETIQELLADSKKINREILKGRSFEEIKDDYKKQYKEIYDVDFVPEDLTEKVMDAKATGGMVKLAAITIISIIVTRSPALTSLAAGSDTAAAAGIMRTLVSKYGQSAVQQGIKFAMTSGTLAADVGLTLLNQVTSERGINGEELWESTKGSAKYIYFGAYIGAPIAQNVGRALGRVGLAKNLFKGGVSSSQGPITTTSVNGEQFAKNLMEQGKQWSTKLISKGGALGTEIGMFSALEIAVDGANVQDAVSEQGTFLPKLKIMNHILEYMLGAKAHKAVMKEPKIELAIQQSGIKTWNIKEIKTPSGTKYTVDIDGIPIGNFKDANTLAAAMMERVAAAYEGVNAGVGVNGDAASSTAQAGKVGVREAVAENPAENVTSRVEKEVYKNEFKDEGMRLNTPERLESELRQAEANPKAPTENIEALSMVTSGKTKQLITQRYNEMAKILDEIHTKYAKEIKQMESKYGSKPQVFAEHFMKFLAAKMGVAGCEPKLEFKKTEGDGAYDWQSGELHISEQLNNLKDIKTMIAHEFIHTLQFRNILAAYGREGIVELYLKHNDGKAINELTRKYVKNEMEIELEDLGLSNAEVSALQRQVAEAYADQCLGNEANARLLRHAQQNPVEKGSLNSYMARLQLDNLIKPEEFDTEAYYRSTNETEAYFLGNGQITGRNSAGETGKASGRRSESEAGISIPPGSTGSGAANRINLIKTINQIPVSGLEPKYEPIQGIVRKALLQELNSNTNSSLPSKIIYEHHPAKPEGAAFISSGDNILHINISYFENLGKNIDKGIKMLEAEGFLSKDIKGKYKIPDYLRNSRTVEFESLLNSNPKSMSLDKQFHFFEESYKYTASLASQIKRSPIVTIETIIKTGNNMELIKNAGLYKSRAEVSKMSIAEQQEYLKILLTSDSQIQIPSNAVREPFPELVFIHEIAHIKHNNSNQNAELKLTEKEWQENKEIQEICTRVSGYARKNQKEFLAEVYAGLQNGQEFHKSVMTLYRKSGGIILKKILQSEAGISIPQGKSASSPSSKDNVLDALQQLGASDKQMMDFSANCTDEIISYIQSRISAPDFNPAAENYFIHLKPFNLALIQELAADPKFPKEQLGLVANAAYSPNFVNQIRNAYKKGIDIIPGCQRVAQMKAAQEARMNDPAAIAKKEAWVNAVKRLEENTSLSKGDINQLADYGNIRETAIQDLIIFCEKNGIKNYHTILLRCSENREGNNISSKEIETRVKFAQKGLENKSNPSDVSKLLWEYEKFSPEEMETRLNTVIKETRIENEKLLAKETAIANKKNSLLEKYNTAEIKEIIERIINKENLPEDLLNSLDEILGGNPNSAKCRYLEKCVSEIKPEEFRLETFKRDFEAGLKKPDLTSKWQSRPNAKNVILTQEYLSSLKDKNGKPVFNQMAVESLLEAGKTNPELVKEVVDMAVEESRLRAPAVIIPLLEAAAIDKDMAFSVLSMKTNNGEPRFNTLELDFVLSSFKSKLPLVKEVFNLERLYNMDVDASGVLLHANEKTAVRTEFSDKYCRILQGMRKSDGSPMYHSYWDIQEGIQKALIDNPEVTLYYLKKNVPTERTAYDGKVIKALINIAQNSAKLEKSLRQELENIKNDENRVQRDEVLRRIRIFSEATDLDNALKIYEHREELGLGNRINYILEKADAIPYENLVYLRDILGKERISTMLMNDLLVAGQFAHLAKVSNINEIPIEGKKNLLRNLISTNSTLFGMSDELAKDFPMLPRNQEQYCEILPAIVRSLGIETTPLTSSKVEVFNKNLNKLSKNLAQISDKDFANLHITQEFSKDDFVKIVLEKVKDLPQTERQKVFDYFGFELNKNEGNKTTGYSIIGYPVNLNNGKKLAQITDPKTQAVVENLRPDVIKFSQNNHIKCENSQIESLLNEIAEVLPEIRTAIGKTQHGTHDYDIMQHSLKVMQKISQDPKFKTLNESDQKIMFLASILHDITKREGFSDKTHANNGSFDTFFIAKKFNLTRAEEIKLYTLIKHHEWLGFVNTSESQEQLTKRLQSVAYDLQHDNLFDMALMFTHADLKAVKKDDSFHDRTDGENRTTLEGTQRSYGASADVYAERLKGMVAELQKSQPLLPVTKIPAVSRMKQAVTNVNSDGSTNIKGVYIDKDGLMIIKFNEVEDWEALGFPKGTTSRGIAAKGLNGRGQECDVETGNIKFFAHALDYANQLAKFDAFGLVDSDVLLSVSYAERPESKFRFFRSQGVLLNVETKYIHGGGNTDSGSGCGKNIQNFKDRYIFGGERESDRLYISNMIKEATGMNDTQYVDFVKANENRSFTEIEPAEYREKIIKAFATINSNVRKGNREYNEMYASNPDVMAVFAYSKNYKNSVGQPVEFVNSNAERLDFLRNFALERDIPMIVFGD